MPKKHSKKPKPRLELGPLDWFCIGASIVISALIALFYHENPPFYTVMSVIALVFGVTGTVLSINGYRSNYIFAFIESFACFYTSWINHFFGNAIINLAFYAPTTLIGFYLWGKHSGKDKKVIARKFTLAQAVIATIVVVASTILLNIALTAFGGKETILDSAATILVIFATILSVLRFREQWIFWLISDILQLIMWTHTNDPAVLTLRIFFPLSAIYGYINWKKLVRSPKFKNRSQ